MLYIVFVLGILFAWLLGYEAGKAISPIALSGTGKEEEKDD